jgi:ferredoxin-NADP reductase
MLQPWQKGKIIRIQQETHNTRRFFIQVPELERFDFKPGQFVTLDLPIHERPNKRWRSYSIASWPDGTNVFELVIVLLEGGAGSTYMFNEAKEGTELTFRGALGVFVLPEKLDRDIFLICTGTGVAPFRSMVHHILINNIPHEKIYIIFGCRKLGDRLYADELTKLEKQLPGFHYLTAFSQEEGNNEATLRLGYVHPIYEELCRGNCTDATLKPAYFYLCGWKAMIDEAKRRILDLGYDKKDVHLELYG